MITQNDAILDYLKRGNTITSLNALKLFGSLRLGARIYELKKRGIKINRRIISVNKKHIAEYYMGE